MRGNITACFLCRLDGIVMIIICLILVFGCNGVSYAKALSTVCRIDSNNVVTQQFADKLLIGFSADSAVVLNNTTLSINDVLIAPDQYRATCETRVGLTACTITVNTTSPSLLTGRFVLQNAAGEIIVTGNNQQELVFTSDNANAIKVNNNLLTDTAIIEAINGVACNLSTNALPADGLLINWPADGSEIVLKCTVNSENLHYIVKKPESMTNNTEENGLVASKWIAGIAIGIGGTVMLGGGGIWWYKSLHQRAEAKNYPGTMEEREFENIKRQLEKVKITAKKARSIADLLCVEDINAPQLHDVRIKLDISRANARDAITALVQFSRIRDLLDRSLLTKTLSGARMFLLQDDVDLQTQQEQQAQWSLGKKSYLDNAKDKAKNALNIANAAVKIAKTCIPPSNNKLEIEAGSAYRDASMEMPDYKIYQILTQDTVSLKVL